VNTLPMGGQATGANSLPVVIASDQPAVPISAASLPLPVGAAQDGADATGVTLPPGGSGIRGWLSGIFNKLNTSITVTGTFWPITQPVSFSSALVAGSAIVGKVGIDQTTIGITNGVTEVGSSNWVVNQVSVGSTATSLVPVRSARQAVVVTNMGATPVYLGGAGVTMINGALLPGVVGASKTIPTTTAVYGIVGANSQIVSIEELY